MFGAEAEQCWSYWLFRFAVRDGVSEELQPRHEISVLQPLLHPAALGPHRHHHD